MVLRQPLPATCRDTVTGNAFFHGCVDELTWFLEDKSGWVAGLAMALATIQVSLLTMMRWVGFYIIALVGYQRSHEHHSGSSSEERGRRS